MKQYEQEKKDLIYWAKLLNDKGFVTARSGNISLKVDEGILLSCHDSYLGHLSKEEVVLVDNNGNIKSGEKKPTSEKDLHCAILNKFKDQMVVIHSHSPFTTAFFNCYKELNLFSFETKLYLGKVEVIDQKTPIVVDVNPVVKAMEFNSVVVLKNHGVVAMGKNFKSAFSLIELLEEQCKVNLVLDKKETKQKEEIKEKSIKYNLFSKEHIDKIKELLDKDSILQTIGREYFIDKKIAFCCNDTKKVLRFVFENSKLLTIDGLLDADCVIDADEEFFRNFFNGKSDIYVSLVQSRVSAVGSEVLIGNCYPFLSRVFKLLSSIPVE